MEDTLFDGDPTLTSISQPHVLAMSRISIDYIIRLPGILPVGNAVHVQVLHKLSEKR